MPFEETPPAFPHLSTAFFSRLSELAQSVGMAILCCRTRSRYQMLVRARGSVTLPVETEEGGKKTIDGIGLARGNTRQIVIPTSLHGPGPEYQCLPRARESYDLPANVMRLGLRWSSLLAHASQVLGLMGRRFFSHRGQWCTPQYSSKQGAACIDLCLSTEYLMMVLT